MEKPTGTFKCVVCGKAWGGSELYLDPQSIGEHWTCGDLLCGANVQYVPSGDPDGEAAPLVYEAPPADILIDAAPPAAAAEAGNGERREEGG